MCFIISKLWFWVVLSIANGGGCQVVSMLAFFPTIQVWIPLKSTQFLFGKLFEKNKNKLKRGREWPIFLK